MKIGWNQNRNQRFWGLIDQLCDDPERFRNLFGVALIVLVSAVSYAHSLDNDFTNWDDQVLVLQNYRIRSLSPKSIARMFTPGATKTYQPLRELSYAIDYHFWRFNPTGYHLVNLLLHMTAAVLLFRILRKLVPEIAVSGRGGDSRDDYRTALFASLLFAVHPVNVEAVAWISSRKYGLLACFSFLAIYFHMMRPSNALHRCLSVLLSVLFVVMAVLSSPFAVSLPFILLLVDWARSRRMNPLGVLKENALAYAPYLVACIVVFPILWRVVVVSPTGAAKMHLFEPLGVTRNIFRSLFDYLRILVFPVRLRCLYENVYPGTFFDYRIVASFCLLTVSGWAAAVSFRKGDRLPLFCMLWFLLWWMPVSGLIPISRQMAERYMYMPSVGFFLFCATLPHAAQERIGRLRNPAGRRLVVLTEAGLILILAFLSFDRNRAWQDSFSLWRDCLRKSPESALAHANLARALNRAGDVPEAEVHLREALRIDPANQCAHLVLADILYSQGRNHSAADHARMVIERDPGSFSGHLNLGKYLEETGKTSQTIVHFQKAADILPDRPEPIYNLACFKQELGHYAEAAEFYRRVLLIDRNSAKSHNNLACILMVRGEVSAAVNHLREAVRIDPDFAEYRFNLGRAFQRAGMFDRAGGFFAGALELDPDHLEARIELANTLLARDLPGKALPLLRESLRIDPANPLVLHNLALALRDLGKREEALRCLGEAVKYDPGNERIRQTFEDVKNQPPSIPDQTRQVDE